MNREVRVAYVPLVDAAPLIVAQELGFAAEEGLRLDLQRTQSWAQLRDLLGAGAVDAAHMLAPMPVAQALGLGPDYPAFDVLMLLSQGGQAVAVSGLLAAAMQSAGHGFDFDNPVRAGAALYAASGGILRMAVPFPFSTHALLMRHWLGACGFGERLSVHTVPPPLMAEALAAGEVDAVCVGEPWASVAVEDGAGVLVLPGLAIWAAAPEKALVMCRDRAERDAVITGALMRALWRAGRWLDQPANRGTAAELLSREEYLDMPPALTEHALMGRFAVGPSGGLREAGDFVRFHRGAASFPWKSVAALMADRLARLHGLDPTKAAVAATGCFRTDLYRQHLRSAGADLPGASAKVEGAMPHPTAVASEQGQMILPGDAFFDGWQFDPAFMGR
ncbi:MAG: CmpA/NrtA family ABC transporter substrate-binding protein [Paracoccaceae bacterium]